MIRKRHFEKIIFLDIDGVICVDFNNYDFKHRHPHFEAGAVQLLNKLIEITNAELVISSTWRKRGMTRIRNIIKREGVIGKVVGRTDVIIDEVTGREIKRGKEIEHWLQTHTTKNYIILDDDSDMLDSQMDHFIRVTSEYGLQQENIDDAISMLNYQSDNPAY